MIEIIHEGLLLRNYSTKTVYQYQSLEDKVAGYYNVLEPRGYIKKQGSGYIVMEEAQFGWTRVFCYLPEAEMESISLIMRKDLQNIYLNNIILPTEAYNYVIKHYSEATNIFEIDSL